MVSEQFGINATSAAQLQSLGAFGVRSWSRRVAVGQQLSTNLNVSETLNIMCGALLNLADFGDDGQDAGKREVA